ncbi:hypothetical protein EV03_2287 [Prochlorococcus marinus str. PAC1]|uniref:Uncharacterized protein n=1 Tax=Prochlorococcus marinus str. PAC1 TaxID=59924 RepID=A0A0A2BWI5_PROMR|nr:hypothetical protein EV03_2287 [Prochlorococcus marinus str. PAC1]
MIVEASLIQLVSSLILPSYFKMSVLVLSHFSSSEVDLRSLVRLTKVYLKPIGFDV